MQRTHFKFAILVLLIDSLAIVLGLILAYLLRANGNELYYWPFDRYLNLIFWILPLWLIFFAMQGLYNPRRPIQSWSAISQILVGLLSGWGAIIIALYLSKTPESQALPRLAITYGLILTFVFTVIGRFILSEIILLVSRQKDWLLYSVLITNGNSQALMKSIKSDPRSDRKLIKVLKSNYLDELNLLIKNNTIDEIIVNDPDLKEEQMLRILDWAESHHCQFTLVPSMLSVRATNVEISTIAGTPIMYFRRTPLEGWGRVFKRCLDIIIVLPTLILLSPVFLLVYLLVKLTSPGKVIFNQPRIGQNGQIFYIHKFRSMYDDANIRFKQFGGWSGDESTDPRITPLGRFLRKSNLDELPQLVDVLIGTMSLVGPRPEQARYVEQFTQAIPDYWKRHSVKSGLSGWAQINNLRGNTSIPERVKYDLYYIENWSIWFDIRIILSTGWYIIRRFID